MTEYKVGSKLWFANVNWEFGTCYKPHPYEILLISWDAETVCATKETDHHVSFFPAEWVFPTQQQAKRKSMERAVQANEKRGYSIPPECVLPDNQ